MLICKSKKKEEDRKEYETVHTEWLDYGVEFKEKKSPPVRCRRCCGAAPVPVDDDTLSVSEYIGGGVSSASASSTQSNLNECDHDRMGNK